MPHLAPSPGSGLPHLALLAGLLLAISACDTSPTPHPGTSDTGDANELRPDVTPPDADTANPSEAADSDLADLVDLVDPMIDITDGPDSDSDSDSDTADDDLGPDTEPLPTEPATVSPLAAGPWRWVVVGGPQTLVASDGDGLAWLVGETASPIVGEGLPSAFIPPAAAALSPSELLLGGATGLVRLVDGVLTPSPLSDRFANEPVTALSVSAHGLWLSSDTRLYHWKDGQLTPIDTAAGPDLAQSLVAALPAAHSEGTGAGAWLANRSGVALLTLAPAALTLERPSLTDVSALAFDQTGHLYALSAHLHVRTPGAALPGAATSLWRTAPLPAPSLVATHPLAPAAWVLYEDEGPQLARGAGTTFARVTGLPPAFAAVRHLGAHADGRLIVATASGLFEVSSSRTLSLPPLPSPLTGPLTLSARASDPAQLTSATATVTTLTGTLPLDATLTGLGAERRATVQLDPLTLPNGALTLTLTVTWSDGESKTASTPFTVDEPTWTHNVSPFFERQCKNCHAADNGGNFASLHTPERWTSRMAEILCRVDQHDPSGEAPECESLGFDVATMPPGRAIAAPQVEMLRRWRDAGYRP